MEDGKDMHRKFAVECFNNTWSLIDKLDRTPEENVKMVHLAHTSRFHWGEIGTALNFARGDWLISRVYAVLGQGENALTYANYCLQLCLENDIKDFDLAFAYEALARAYSILNNKAMEIKFLELAKKAGTKINKSDDKKYFFEELNTISRE